MSCIVRLLYTRNNFKACHLEGCTPSYSNATDLSQSNHLNDSRGPDFSQKMVDTKHRNCPLRAECGPRAECCALLQYYKGLKTKIYHTDNV